jgi:hypothetical protein
LLIRRIILVPALCSVLLFLGLGCGQKPPQVAGTAPTLKQAGEKGGHDVKKPVSD